MKLLEYSIDDIFGFPLVFPYGSFVHSFDKLLHPGSAFLLHLLSYMAIDIQGKSRGGVAQIFLYGFDIITGTDSCYGIGVP